MFKPSDVASNNRKEDYLTSFINEYLIYLEYYAEPFEFVLNYARSLYKHFYWVLDNKPLTMKLPFLSVNHLEHKIEDLYYNNSFGFTINYLKQAIDIILFYANGLGNDYREVVELKGTVVSDNLVETPFSNRKVAYCESKLSQVAEIREQYRDSNGNMQTRIRKHENTISNEKSSQEISIKDNSSNEPVVLEINSTGCKLDIPKTFDRFEPKGNLLERRCYFK